MVVIEARVLDATHLELAKPIQTPAGGRLLVYVADPGEEDNEASAWFAASAASLAAAYGESEPEYGPEMIKERNPEYEG